MGVIYLSGFFPALAMCLHRHIMKTQLRLTLVKHHSGSPLLWNHVYQRIWTQLSAKDARLSLRKHSDRLPVLVILQLPVLDVP